MKFDAMAIITALWISLDIWMVGVCAIFVLICYILYRLDKAQDTSFNFHDLWTSGDWPGKASTSRIAYFGGWLVHSLVIMHQEFHKSLTEATLTMYALIWSGAYVVLKFIENRATASTASSSVTQTTTIQGVSSETQSKNP